mmetsp:Transcript_42184/g.98882  ORF Transcript_42184/g.98882 Transcript_42184/m.98882 type:complete len:133 (-) Transcript_42184:20-418(-)
MITNAYKSRLDLLSVQMQYNFLKSFNHLMSQNLGNWIKKSTYILVMAGSGTFFPSFLIGLTIRFYAGILMHVVNRPQQNEPPLKKVLSWNLFKSCRKVQLVAFFDATASYFNTMFDHNGKINGSNRKTSFCL